MRDIAPKKNWGNERTVAIASYAYEMRITLLHPSMGANVYSAEEVFESYDNECIIWYNGKNHYNSTIHCKCSGVDSGDDSYNNEDDYIGIRGTGSHGKSRHSLNKAWKQQA